MIECSHPDCTNLATTSATRNEQIVLADPPTCRDHRGQMFKCDGCGLVELGEKWPDGSWHKRSHWYSRKDADGEQFACSRDCIKIVAERTGKTSLVMPW